jgi:tryptophan halogenase
MPPETAGEARIRRVVIVGGGTAGWMTAAAMSTVLDGELCNIELIESDQIGIVGVGEATIPAIHDFNRKIGLDEQDFMRSTHATFKLGIEFVNWAKVGDAYMHPFGRFGFDINGVAFHHYWLDQRKRGDQTPYYEYCVPFVAGKRGRFALPQNDPRSVLSTYSYAFHFDASLYAQYLRRVAEGRGVLRTEGLIVDVSLRGEDGFIESVTLEDGRSIAGDLFIDCSGFRALLIDKALGTEYESWKHWLPCDRAVAIPCENPDVLDPYTRATAHSAGWQWRIPLQHRTGNGHVYCSDFMSDDEARSIALKNIERSPIGEPRLIKFVAGKRKQMWSKNCVAIGLSGGFLEPLESTSIYLIQAAIMKLIERFPDRNFFADDIADFNSQMSRTFDQVRDFIILHYKATSRSDSEFWNYCRTMSVPESLDYKIRSFRESGHVVYSKRELFIETNWVAVFLGQDVIPCALDLRVDCVPPENIAAQMQKMREVIKVAAESLPRHTDTISNYCPARLGDLSATQSAGH